MNIKETTGYPSIDKPWLKYFDQDKINVPLPSESMYQYVWEANKNHPDDIAIHYDGNEITYQTLFDEIDQVSESFRNQGIKPGDVVSFLSLMSPEMIYSFYALNKIGAVCNMLDPRLSEKIVVSILQRTSCRYLIIMDGILSEKRYLLSKPGLTTIVLPMAGDNYSPELSSPSVLLWSQIKSCVAERSQKAYFKKGSPAIIEYTGGTTGEPKGVVLSNENANAVAHQFKRLGFSLDRGNTWLTVSAPFISYTLIMSLHLPLSFGIISRIVTYEPHIIASEVVNNKYNYIPGSPPMWETVIHTPEAQNQDFSHLLAPISGADYMGSALEEEINQFFKNHGCDLPILQGYGLTETASGICVNLGGNKCKFGSVGIPFIDTTVAIFDPDTGEEVKYNHTGEICISGPSVMLGYFGNQEATDEMISIHLDGLRWLHSGDLGHMDEDGFIYIDGRIKRMFAFYNGQKVFPPVIEKVIMKSQKVFKCVVVGAPDPGHKMGQVPVAFVILNEKFKRDFTEVKEELIMLCKSELPTYDIPFDWHFVDEYPLTPIGKVDYRKLEAQLI